jgi:hypothetical protein
MTNGSSEGGRRRRYLLADEPHRAGGEGPPPAACLYVRADCPLCEEAATLLARHYPHLVLETLDVDREPALAAVYGERVPVLACEGRELDWPFGPEDVDELLGVAH